MTKPKLTRWFSGKVKPVRNGYYECKLPSDGAGMAQFDYWNGKKWSFEIGQLYYEVKDQDTYQWRGLMR